MDGLPRGSTTKSLVTFGETMIRFEPIDAEPPTRPTRHHPQAFLRSLGGDELNVSVALSLLGVRAQWVSVLPSGPMGDIVLASCAEHGVDFCGERVDGDIGTYTVLPETKTVHYQRKHSTFALHDPSLLSWSRFLHLEGSESKWLHLTGISPLVSASAKQSWQAAIEQAISLRIPVSLDLNHRKQLGTLEELWAVVSPYCARFEVIVLSEEQLVGLCHIHELTVVQGAETDELYLDLMSKLQELWRCRRVALCRKARDSGSQQRRWSLLTVLDEELTISRLSTASLPVVSQPKEDIGGGSAWMAGFLHGIYFEPVAEQEALRRADLLASLCQESKGDFSTVTRAQLLASEEAWLGQVAALGTGTAVGVPDETGVKIEATLKSLGRAGVLAIMRNKGSPDVAVRRGLELAEMGCRALEITMDSTDWATVLGQLHERLPSDVVLGVGTVMDNTVCDLERAAALGASFALSPIDPIGFVEECSRLGILAVPSAFTSNECWQLHRRGVRLIKLFHAGLLSPSILKSMLDVTPLGDNLNIMPSGGVTPTNLDAWLDAGAVVVGMGSNLAGKDIAFLEGTPEFAAAQKDWEEKGKAIAEELFVKVAKRNCT